MCEVYGFCGSRQIKLNQFTDEFWTHSRIHKDGFGYYLVDKRDYYVNPGSAMNYIKSMCAKNFNSKLALCHIRFKTHGPAIKENCHPFIKHDTHSVEWSLIHNGYIDDNLQVEALGQLQVGDTDSERILLSIVESVNQYYEHSFINNLYDFLNGLYSNIERSLNELSELGKINLVFTDGLTNNMYVYMNHPGTLYFLKTDDGVHVSTLPLTKDNWELVPPHKLHVINNGKFLKE